MSSFWHSSPVRVMGSRVLETRLRQALDYLQTRAGVRVPDTGRHRKALALLSSLNSSDSRLDPDDHQMMARLQYANRDAWELFMVAYAASLRRKRADTPFTVQRLQTIMSGSDLGDGSDPHPRNIQFELYVAAMLVLGGLDVRDGEPDLRMLYGPELIGVAAKRLTSLTAEQAERNFSKAVEQIERSGLRGLVAVNADSRATGAPSTMTEEERIGHFERLFASIEPVFEAYREGHPRVLGYLAFAHISEWVAGSASSDLPRLLDFAPFRWFGWPNSDEEAKLYHALSDEWQSRVERHLEHISGKDAL
jgi:hypothetical protein